MHGLSSFALVMNELIIHILEDDAMPMDVLIVVDVRVEIGVKC